ncbi:unnamed protein product, partial [Symbiodinium microadriaticum]
MLYNSTISELVIRAQPLVGASLSKPASNFQADDHLSRSQENAWAVCVDKSTNKTIHKSDLCRKHPNIQIIITREDLEEEEESL